MNLFLFPLTLILLLETSAASKPVLEIHYFDEITVAGGNIRFSDIATVRGKGPEVENLENIVVGRAAGFGLSRFLSTSSLYPRYLASLADKYDVRIAGEKRIRINTDSGVLPRDSLAEMVSLFLSDQNSISTEDCRFEFLSVPKQVKVPQSRHTLSLRAPNGFERKGRQTLELIIQGAGDLKRVIPIGIYIRLYDSVWVSDRLIVRDSPITSQNIRIAYRDITRLAGMPVRRLVELRGKLAKQTITAGRILTTRLVKLEPLIRQGESVRILSRYNGIVLTLEGIARQDGCLGQIIRVKWFLNHQVVRARVLENGLLKLVSAHAKG